MRFAICAIELDKFADLDGQCVRFGLVGFEVNASIGATADCSAAVSIKSDLPGNQKAAGRGQQYNYDRKEFSARANDLLTHSVTTTVAFI